MKEKKVLCIKDTIGFNKGEVWNAGEGYLSNSYKQIFTNWECSPEYFKEVEEEEEIKKPRWKIGDYVVKDYESYPKKFIKIFSISQLPDECGFSYNQSYILSDLRDPTEEEINLYFR